MILPEIFGQRNNFEVIKVKTQWSRSISITSVVVADLRHLNVPKIKLNTALNMLATKWINDTIEPPIVEGLAPYYPAVSFKKSAKKITKKTGNSNLE